MSGARWLRAAGFALVALAFTCSLSASAQTPATPKGEPVDARVLAAEVTREGGYPTELSVGDAPARQVRLGGGKANFLSAALEIVVWVVAAALLVALVWLLLRGRAAARREPPRAPHDEARLLRRAKAASQASVLPDPWLVDGDPDALAAQGDYERAMAAMLVRALRAAGWGHSQTENAVTAREVAARLPPSDARRVPLQQCITLAELVRFGGRPASESTYLALREAAGLVTTYGAQP